MVTRVLCNWLPRLPWLYGRWVVWNTVQVYELGRWVALPMMLSTQSSKSYSNGAGGSAIGSAANAASD